MSITLATLKLLFLKPLVAMINSLHCLWMQKIWQCHKCYWR